jgi:pimeloyl-ACP methyl ester carboxylesterase
VDREGRVTLADGRTLAYVERGERDGYPVVFQHGTPGSRHGHHPDPEVYRGIRFFTFDRPGYGLSDPLPGRRVADVAADVSALADHLGLERFAVFGASGGGPHALACAALLPDRVDRALVMVGAAPSDDPEFDFMAGMAEVNVVEFGAALEGEETLAQVLAPWVEQIAEDPEGMLDRLAAELPDYDREVVSRPEIRAEIVASFGESVRQGARGWIDDDLAFARSWGFDLADVGPEVRLLQGDLDVLVPRAHCEYLAGKLPRATFELVPGAGHMLFDHWPDALAQLLE